MDKLLESKTVSVAAICAIKMLLLTGARLNEILSLKWEWIDFDQRIAALPDSKSGAKPVFLNFAAMKMLKEQKGRTQGSPYVFPGAGKTGRMINLSKPWKAVCSEAEVEGVRLHDLRHTMASVAVGQGASLPLIGRLLGHSQAQTTQRYAHVDADPALVASDAVGDAISRSLSPE
ncbi:hypothetical protein GCM10011411_26820 [Aurantiacibacter arachoides]|nr:hypothetical protein GCM10011411_26820 [Aurantiacibacter arachoides]